MSQAQLLCITFKNSFGSALSRLIICFCSHLESFPGWRVCRSCVGACGLQPNLTQPTLQGHRRTALVPPLKTLHDSSATYELVPEFWGLDEICFWGSSSWAMGSKQLLAQEADSLSPTDTSHGSAGQLLFPAPALFPSFPYRPLEVWPFHAPRTVLGLGRKDTFIF